MDRLTLLCCGENPRLNTLLSQLPQLQNAERLDASALAQTDLRGKRLLFTAAIDAFGESEAFLRMLRTLRANPSCLEGSTAALIVDGESELYTKDLARRLVFAANQAGCGFPGKPLVEATGSLHNLRVLQKKHELDSLVDAYRFAASSLLDRLLGFSEPKREQPRLLVLHASDRSTSNTLALADLVTKQLGGFQIDTISLRNGTIHDCRGCSYKVCANYAARGGCFYGGSIAEEVLPAVLQADALLLLCPNYNDAIGANIMAFINRMTSLTVSNALYGRSLYAIVVSGYSGGDIVAQQLLGALCLNKAFSLPPRFCLIKTANDPGQVLRLPGIEQEAAAFAEQMRTQLLGV